jgi:hypothetical protein
MVADNEPDFLSSSTWPPEVLSAAALQRAKAQQRRIHADIPARSRYTLIAGSGRETTAHAVKIAPGQFKFADGDGDGTVPLRLCLLPNVGQLYFTGAKHGNMPTDDDIVDAVFDILQGNDAKLPKTVPLQRSIRTLRPHTFPVVEIPDYNPRARARAQVEAARRRGSQSRLTPGAAKSGSHKRRGGRLRAAADAPEEAEAHGEEKARARIEAAAAPRPSGRHATC